MTKRYINVAYDDREMAKRLGARWDPSVKRWYCPPGSALAKIYSWRKAPAPSRAALPEPSLAAMNAGSVSRSISGHAGSGQLSLLG